MAFDLSKIKGLTHVFAVVGLAIVGFVVSPAGQAVVKQYPVTSGIAGAIVALGAIYHQPQTAGTTVAKGTP
jgi:hypothetical protein